MQRTKPKETDVLILGGGPAGMSALLWCHSLGLRGRLIERAPEMGGQMLVMYHQIFDYPGLAGLTGAELRDRFVAHLAELGLAWQTGCALDEVELRARRVHCDGAWLEAGALVLATGARKRRLDVPGEDRFAIQSGISYSATRDHSLYAGKRVAVIGGGDSAIENALILSRVCPHVTLIHRSDRFRAREEWFAEAARTPNITMRLHLDVLAIEGRDRVERLRVMDRQTGLPGEIETEGVFIRVGIAPNTELFRDQIDLDDEGYIAVDASQRTSLPAVYAIGDVCRPVCWSVATAVGHGAIALKAIKREPWL
jgi:thioredoxin reductase (NADPH)